MEVAVIVQLECEGLRRSDSSYRTLQVDQFQRVRGYGVQDLAYRTGNSRENALLSVPREMRAGLCRVRYGTTALCPTPHLHVLDLLPRAAQLGAVGGALLVHAADLKTNATGNKSLTTPVHAADLGGVRQAARTQLQHVPVLRTARCSTRAKQRAGRRTDVQKANHLQPPPAGPYTTLRI